MDRSFGEGYITTVKNEQSQSSEATFDIPSDDTVTMAGDVALDQLKRALLALNVMLVLIVPGVSWILTSRTLKPIEEAHDKQRRFVSDASHELRTPLTIMQGELDVALKSSRTMGEYQATLQSTKEEVLRLNELAEALLLIARGDQTNTIMSSQTVDMTDIIHETILQMQPLAKSKKIKLNFEPPEVAVELEGSRGMLRQLISNLVENALKFTLAKGSVTVNLVVVGREVHIEVTDTGVGMDAATKTQAFDRFYQAESSRKQQGHGLGLSICKVIVEQHRGSIRLSSSIGNGTIVRIVLPRS